VENILSRHRNLTILVAVLFAEVVGLGVQVKRSSDIESTRLIRVWTVGAVTPLEKAFVVTTGGAKDLWHNYFYLRGVRAENRALQQQIRELQIEQVRMREDAVQARRLQLLLGFKEQFISHTVAAQVIGSSGTDLSRSVFIDKGAKDGIQQDMAVITAQGIAGKVLKVFSNSSQVLLINDASSGVGAILQKSRLQGVVKGSSGGETMLEKVMSDEQVEAGETVLTSGGDRIFPKGLPIGTVMKVKPGAELFLNIRLKPAADLGRLEEVLVITKLEERQPTTQEAQGPVRAIDILAARLPSVPDKAAASVPAATGKAADGITAAAGGNASSADEPPAAKPAMAGVAPNKPAANSGAAGGSASIAGKVLITRPATTGAASPRPATNRSAAPGQNMPAGAPSLAPKKATGKVAGTPATAPPKKISDTAPEESATEPRVKAESPARATAADQSAERKPPSARAKAPVAENAPSSQAAPEAPPQP
jgi:rod shape-determining protein MreC